jgi:hypothetical protein
VASAAAAAAVAVAAAVASVAAAVAVAAAAAVAVAIVTEIRHDARAGRGFCPGAARVLFCALRSAGQARAWWPPFVGRASLL